MNVFFGQLYIEPGIKFRFSTAFQRFLGSKITSMIVPSDVFAKKYGIDFDIMFRISAKSLIDGVEIKGPTIFKKTKDIEFAVFLPFDKIMQRPDSLRMALDILLESVCAAFELLRIDPSEVFAQKRTLIEAVLSDPTMLDA